MSLGWIHVVLYHRMDVFRKSYETRQMKYTIFYMVLTITIQRLALFMVVEA